MGGLCANLRPVIISAGLVDRSEAMKCLLETNVDLVRQQCLPKGVDRVGAGLSGTVELSICECCGIRP